MFFTLITAAAVSVWGGTSRDGHEKSVDGVLLRHDRSSVDDYGYLVFTNTNPYRVKVSYKVKGAAEATIVLEPKASMRTLSAYRVDREVDMVVSRSADTEAATRSVSNQRRR